MQLEKSLQDRYKEERQKRLSAETDRKGKLALLPVMKSCFVLTRNPLISLENKLTATKVCLLGQQVLLLLVKQRADSGRSLHSI
jgi:hypothetical protein